MSVFRVLFIAVILSSISVSAFPEYWHTFQDVNNARDITVAGDDVWMTLDGGGVLRWNSISRKYIRYNTTNGLANNATDMIFKDSRNRIWAPNGGGISCFENEKWKFYGAEDGLSIEGITSITEDKTGMLWFGTTQQGVWSFNGKKWERYWREKWNFTSNINVVTPIGNGEVLFGRYLGIYRFDGKEWSKFADQDSGLANGIVYSLLKTENGNLFAGTYFGLSLFDGKGWKTIKGTENDKINAMAMDAQGVLWLATDKQILRLENDQVTGMENREFVSVFIDSKGVKWFCSRWSGLLRIDGVNQTWYQKGDGLAGDSMVGMVSDHKGILWAASTSGLSRFIGGKWEKVSSIAATAITVDQNGDIWVGMANGLYKYRDLDGSWELFEKCGPFPLVEITSLAIDDTGALWVGAMGGISRYDGTSWEQYSYSNNFSSEGCAQIVVDNDDRKWFLCPNGFYTFDNIFWKFDYRSDFSWAASIGIESNGKKWLIVNGNILTSEENVPGNSQFILYPRSSLPTGASSFMRVTIDSHDSKWFRTYKNGLFRLDGDNWTHFSINAGLADSMITRCTRTDDDSIWAFSPHGVSRFAHGQWGRFAISAICPGDNLIFSSAIDNHGDKWFGAAKGILRFSKGRWTIFTPASGLPEGKAASLVIQADGTVWAGYTGYETDPGTGFYGGGISHQTEEGWVTTHRNFNIDTMAIDKTGMVWMAYSDSGYPYLTRIAYFRDDQWNVLTLSETFLGKRCLAIAFDGNNTMWFGLESVNSPVQSIIVSYDGVNFTTYSNPDLRYLLSRGLTGALWFSSMDGTILTRYTGATWDTFSPPNSLGTYGKYSPYYDTVFGGFIKTCDDLKGNTWFSAQSGLLRFDGTSWKLYSDTDDFTLSSAIRTISIDQENTVWIGTAKGIASLSEKPIGVFEENDFPASFTITNFPNPFNPSTTISYTLPSSGKATLAIYDITGRKVRELAAGTMPAGTHRVVWDGRDANGAAVASGIYLAHVSCGNRTVTGKMLLMK